MSRSRKKNQPKCPEGHDCIWCGPKVARELQEAKAPTLEEFEDHDTSDTVRECLLCGTVAPEWQLCRDVCPHGVDLGEFSTAPEYTFPLMARVEPCGCEWRRDPAQSPYPDTEYGAKAAGWTRCEKHR